MINIYNYILVSLSLKKDEILMGIKEEFEQAENFARSLDRLKLSTLRHAAENQGIVPPDDLPDSQKTDPSRFIRKSLRAEFLKHIRFYQALGRLKESLRKPKQDSF